jgi:hypothetical protein
MAEPECFNILEKQVQYFDKNVEIVINVELGPFGKVNLLF